MRKSKRYDNDYNQRQGEGSERGSSDERLYQDRATGGFGSSEYSQDRSAGGSQGGDSGYGGRSDKNMQNRGEDWGQFSRRMSSQGDSFGQRDYGPRDYEQGSYEEGPYRGLGQRYGDQGYGTGGFRGNYGQGSFGGSRSDYGGNDRGMFERAGDEVASWFGDEDAARRRKMDHRGRGPKGYSRSDDRIREDVNDRLTDDWKVDASSIEVTVEGGEVTLTGEVESREAKRHAEDCVENVSGVTHVQNNLRVKSPGSSTSGSASGDDPSGLGGTGSSSRL
jgi:osmotically-inducible protein OsmY